LQIEPVIVALLFGRPALHDEARRTLVGGAGKLGIGLRLGERRLELGELRARLGKLLVELGRCDGGEQAAGLDMGADVDRAVDDIAGGPRIERRAVVGLHRAGQIDQPRTVDEADDLRAHARHQIKPLAQRIVCGGVARARPKGAKPDQGNDRRQRADADQTGEPAAMTVRVGGSIRAPLRAALCHIMHWCGPFRWSRPDALGDSVR
jgi:hypothetical protein